MRLEKLKDEIRAMVKEVYPDREWVLVFGEGPAQARLMLVGEKETIGQAHGQMRRQEDRLYFPMYHPASMIYNPGLKAIFAQDMEKLGQLIKNIPIFNE